MTLIPSPPPHVNTRPALFKDNPLFGPPFRPLVLRKARPLPPWTPRIDVDRQPSQHPCDANPLPSSLSPPRDPASTHRAVVSCMSWRADVGVSGCMVCGDFAAEASLRQMKLSAPEVGLEVADSAGNTALHYAGETPPSPCASTAYVAEKPPFPCSSTAFTTFPSRFHCTH